MSTAAVCTSDDILTFWFETLAPADRFKTDAQLDATIRTRFGATHAAARAAELHAWRDQPRGRLAEVIVLDQFSRNMYRHTPDAFAQDAQALTLAQEAVRAGADDNLETGQRAFLYMPFMHSESPAIHEWAMTLFDRPGLDKQLHYEQRHKAIVDRFGRYPHRNAILGRESSAEELRFLERPGSSF